MVDARRVNVLNDRPIKDGPVVYWMQRDQRAHDNWALLYAKQCADEMKVPLYVVFNLVPTYGHATWRHYDFMLRGLEEVATSLAEKNIGFLVTYGDPDQMIYGVVKQYDIGHVVTDFNPMQLPESWKESVGTTLPVRLSEVDAHNIVPCWVASDKQEFAAYTFRPKVHKLLPEFLINYPNLTTHQYDGDTLPAIDWERLREQVDVDRSVEPVQWCAPGEAAAKRRLRAFIDNELNDYAEKRNDPNADALSNLSPYYHFGQLSAQTAALAVEAKRGTHRDNKEAYLEELIVRKELSDNYCFYNQTPDKVAGAHAWAQETIAEHANDEREYTYSKAQFEAGETHDELWNAMQQQMVKEGKLHGWCRMYWAKKILEWTPDAQTAIDIALYLNDKYELDGRDPNGIVGVMWSICGVHDRAWTERPIFGKIRYMNYNGAKRKFDVAAYVARYSNQDQLFTN